jgi:charged multivesicular body protein 3
MAAKKTRLDVKKHATRGDVKSARILAREVVRATKQIDRLSVSKARLGSINTQLQQQLCMSNIIALLVDLAEMVISHGKSDRFPPEVH